MSVLFVALENVTVPKSVWTVEPGIPMAPMEEAEAGVVVATGMPAEAGIDWLDAFTDSPPAEIPVAVPLIPVTGAATLPATTPELPAVVGGGMVRVLTDGIERVAGDGMLRVAGEGMPPVLGVPTGLNCVGELSIAPGIAVLREPVPLMVGLELLMTVLLESEPPTVSGPEPVAAPPTTVLPPLTLPALLTLPAVVWEKPMTEICKNAMAANDAVFISILRRKDPQPVNNGTPIVPHVQFLLLSRDLTATDSETHAAEFPTINIATLPPHARGLQ